MAVAAKVWRSYVPRPEKLIIIVASRIFPAYANTYERGVCIAIRVAAATARPPRNSLEHTSPFRVNQPNTIPRGLSTPLSRTRERGDTLRTRAPTNALSDHTREPAGESERLRLYHRFDCDGAGRTPFEEHLARFVRRSSGNLFDPSNSVGKDPEAYSPRSLFSYLI